MKLNRKIFRKTIAIMTMFTMLSATPAMADIAAGTYQGPGDSNVSGSTFQAVGGNSDSASAQAAAAANAALQAAGKASGNTSTSQGTGITSGVYQGPNTGTSSTGATGTSELSASAQAAAAANAALAASGHASGNTSGTTNTGSGIAAGSYTYPGLTSSGGTTPTGTSSTGNVSTSGNQTTTTAATGTGPSTGSQNVETVQNITSLEGANTTNTNVSSNQSTAGNTTQTAGTSSGTTAGTSTQATTTTSNTANGHLVYSNGRYVDTTKPMVALTYDDGPYAAVGNIIMDECKKVDGRVTFFVVGNRVSSYKTEVQRMVAEGHEIANHSYTHALFNHLSGSEIQAEISKCNAAVQQYAGVTPTLMRLPGGNINSTVRNNVNMPMIYWSVDTLDWKTKNAQSTINAVVGKVKDGDIVLMHEIWSSTGVAARTIIPELAAKGYQLVTVSELIKFKGASVSGGNGKQYADFR